MEKLWLRQKKLLDGFHLLRVWLSNLQGPAYELTDVGVSNHLPPKDMAFKIWT